MIFASEEETATTTTYAKVAMMTLMGVDFTMMTMMYNIILNKDLATDLLCRQVRLADLRENGLQGGLSSLQF